MAATHLVGSAKETDGNVEIFSVVPVIRSSKKENSGATTCCSRVNNTCYHFFYRERGWLLEAADVKLGWILYYGWRRNIR